MNPNKKRQEQLRHLAYDREIVKKVVAIVEELGSATYFEDSKLEIKIWLGGDITVKLKPSGDTVFLTRYKGASSYSTKTTLEPRGDGGYDVVEHHDYHSDYHNRDDHSVSYYAVGNWEDHLDEIYSCALSRKNTRWEEIKKSVEKGREKDRYDERKRFVETQLRHLCAEVGLNLDNLSEDQRKEFVDRWLREK